MIKLENTIIKQDQYPADKADIMVTSFCIEERYKNGKELLVNNLNIYSH